MILTVIDGIPLYSTVEEALQWGNSRMLTGFHTHVYEGQTGYMGGSNHFTATNTSRPARSSGGGGGGGGGGY
jgi:hypothetical protein